MVDRRCNYCGQKVKRGSAAKFCSSSCRQRHKRFRDRLGLVLAGEEKGFPPRFLDFIPVRLQREGAASLWQVAVMLRDYQRKRRDTRTAEVRIMLSASRLYCCSLRMVETAQTPVDCAVAWSFVREAVLILRGLQHLEGLEGQVARAVLADGPERVAEL